MSGAEDSEDASMTYPPGAFSGAIKFVDTASLLRVRTPRWVLRYAQLRGPRQAGEPWTCSVPSGSDLVGVAGEPGAYVLALLVDTADGGSPASSSVTTLLVSLARDGAEVPSVRTTHYYEPTRPRVIGHSLAGLYAFLVGEETSMLPNAVPLDLLPISKEVPGW